VTYRLLALDLDGTVLRRDGTVHPRDRRAVARLRASGVPVTIATGRLYSGTRRAARELSISGPVACVDGSQIVDTRGDERLVYRGIAGAPALRLRDVLESRPSARFVFAGDGIFHDLDGQPYAPYVRTWSEDVEVVHDVSAHPAWHTEEGLLAVVVVGAPDDIDAMAAAVAQEVPTARVLSFGVRRYEDTSAMVIREREPDKGTAVTWLANHYGCTDEEVVVVGDWLNDVPMMQKAGRAFAMAHAPEEVRAVATDVLTATADDEGGVAEAISLAFGLEV
jgi:Cof subfamily protein (haloacid dehalogenase superfamily)